MKTINRKKPMWVVYIDKKGKLDAYDYFLNWKSPLTKMYGDRANDHIIGYVCFNRKELAIDYCVDMGFENSHKTDHNPMRPWQRGEILWLLHDQKHSLLYVAEKTNRSIDWVRIVGGISGRARQELINMYMEEKDGFNIKTTIEQEEVSSGISTIAKRGTNKSVHTKRTKRRIPTHHAKRYNTQTGLGQTGKTSKRASNNPNKQGIADGMRKSKDYKGE